MATFITKTIGIMDPQLPHTQGAWLSASQQLQILPISLFYYQTSLENPEQLDTRLDGILSGVHPNDDVIIQLPIYLADQYLAALVDKVKLIGDISSTRLVFIINSLPDGPLTPNSFFVKICNRADQLIVATPEMGRYLRRLHINVPMTYFYFWDFAEPELEDLSLPQNTGAVNSYQGEDWYSYPFKLQQRGGYGLIWPQDRHFASWIPEMVTERFVAAGLPLITKSNTALANFIHANDVGIVVDRQADYPAALNQVSDADYQRMANNMQRWAQVVRVGGCLTAALATTQRKLKDAKRRIINNAD